MMTINLNKRNIIALILAVLIAAVFLNFVLMPPSAFNFLPFEIHERLKPTRISEGTFIKMFDVFSSFVVLIVSYLILRRRLRRTV